MYPWQTAPAPQQRRSPTHGSSASAVAPAFDSYPVLALFEPSCEGDLPASHRLSQLVLWEEVTIREPTLAVLYVERRRRVLGAQEQ